MGSPAEFSRFNLPIFLSTADLLALVVGGGPVGQRKMGVLLAAGATVRLVCLEPQPAGLIHLRLEWRSEPYKAEHLDGAKLVFTAATDDVNGRVQADAAARGLLVCRADDAPMGDFITPAVVSSGRRFKLALTTGGASPALSRCIRSRLWEMFDDTFGEWVDLLDDWRDRAGSGAWQNAGGRREFLERISEWSWLDRFRAEGAVVVNRAYAELATELGLSVSVA
jgi:precorrin-2 dehydrogenase/sirohydrochlorin ferrochelatase